MFGSIFSENSSFNNVVGKIVDIIWLNILTVICCLPIVTIGTSLTAMYTVLFKMVDNEEGYITRTFFKAFKENFKKSTVIWMMAAMILFVTSYEMKILDNIKALSSLMLVFRIAMVLIVLGLVFVFPLCARYENTIKNTIKNAYIYSVICLPQTIFLIIVNVVPVYVMYKAHFLVLFISLFGVAFVGYMNARIFLHIFKKYEKNTLNDVISNKEKELQN